MTILHATLDRIQTISPSQPWKAAAVTAFAQQSDSTALRATFAQRLRILIGYKIGFEQIWVDQPTLVAGTIIDGVLFRWEHERLFIQRPCAYCGVGSFTSPALHTLADIGHALSAWQPRHADCDPSDPAE